MAGYQTLLGLCGLLTVNERREGAFGSGIVHAVLPVRHRLSITSERSKEIRTAPAHVGGRLVVVETKHFLNVINDVGSNLRDLA
jgi:hypothetical protein